MMLRTLFISYMWHTCCSKQGLILRANELSVSFRNLYRVLQKLNLKILQLT